MAVPFVAEIESNLPILANGNTQFDKNFVAGNGTSIDVLIPSYGNTGTGADITGANFFRAFCYFTRNTAGSPLTFTDCPDGS